MLKKIFSFLFTVTILAPMSIGAIASDPTSTAGQAVLSPTAPYKKDNISGLNVRIVHYGNQRVYLGGYKLFADKKWEEFKVPKNNRVAELTETSRDKDTVTLFNADAGVTIILDIKTKGILYSDLRRPTPRRVYSIVRLRR